MSLISLEAIGFCRHPHDIAGTPQAAQVAGQAESDSAVKRLFPSQVRVRIDHSIPFACLLAAARSGRNDYNEAILKSGILL